MQQRTRLSSLAVTFGAAILALTAVPRLRADEFDNKTFITFNSPVEIAGKALPAGTYVFKTFQDDKDIVVVMTRDEDRLVALINAVPIEAPSIPDKAYVDLTEGSANSPEVVHAWFYPGDQVGWEFPAARLENK
jgi:hypothetical protein